MATLWISPLDGCDICGHTFGAGLGETPVMLDAVVRGGWGNVCERCFNSDPRAGLGIGRGQRYELKTVDFPYVGARAWVGTQGFDK